MVFQFLSCRGGAAIFRIGGRAGPSARWTASRRKHRFRLAGRGKKDATKAEACSGRHRAARTGSAGGPEPALSGVEGPAGPVCNRKVPRRSAMPCASRLRISANFCFPFRSPRSGRKNHCGGLQVGPQHFRRPISSRPASSNLIIERPSEVVRRRTNPE
jgi:hypothetical protein